MITLAHSPYTGAVHVYLENNGGWHTLCGELPIDHWSFLQPEPVKRSDAVCGNCRRSVEAALRRVS